MWDAKRLLRCGERLYRAGKYALCALLIGLLVLLVLALVSLLRFGAVLFVAGDAMLTAAWIAALAACAAGLPGAPSSQYQRNVKPSGRRRLKRIFPIILRPASDAW